MTEYCCQCNFCLHLSLTLRHYNSGISVGAADMYLRFNEVQNNTVIWTALYDQGRRWNQVTVQLGRITQPFQIALAKISLGVFDGISAFDDVSFRNCSMLPAVAVCPTDTHFHCVRTKVCVDHLQLCDLVDDCGDGSDEEGCCEFPANNGQLLKPLISLNQAVCSCFYL